MILPEIRLLQAAITLAEELHFSRAAERLHIEQSTLSRRILELENQVDVELFDRNHQRVEITEAGTRFVEEARQAMAHIERAVFSARLDANGRDELLRIGRSPYTDPWLASMMLAIRLPLHPGLRIQWSSNYSHELAREVIAGVLDLALITGVPETPKLTYLRLAEHPFYIAMSHKDPLTACKEVRLKEMHGRSWVLFSRHVSPHMYDTIRQEVSVAGISASDLHHATGAEEAVPLILEHGGLAFLTRTGAWRIARDGITMRPLAEKRLRLVTSLAVRANSRSRLINEFVKASARKLENIRRPIQANLPLSA
jgi:DNA-binding transcriptional LysR family regulator